MFRASPILILSAINTSNERTELLNMGVDDYMGKPFSTQELIARIYALLRRKGQDVPVFQKIGNSLIDTNKRTVSAEDKSINLTAKEFSLLMTMIKEIGKVWNKNELIDIVWEMSINVDTHVVESTILNLRKKLQEINSSIQISNMRNIGYWIE